MQLAAEGLVDLQAPLTRYLPWFSIQSKYRSITIHDVLTHTADSHRVDPVPDARAEVWLLHHTATFAAPGENFLYSTVGYQALSLVLEAVLAQPYARIVEWSLQPCGTMDRGATRTGWPMIRDHPASGWRSTGWWMGTCS